MENSRPSVIGRISADRFSSQIDFYHILRGCIRQHLCVEQNIVKLSSMKEQPESLAQAK